MHPKLCPSGFCVPSTPVRQGRSWWPARAIGMGWEVLGRGVWWGAGTKARDIPAVSKHPSRPWSLPPRAPSSQTSRDAGLLSARFFNKETDIITK